MKNSGLVKSIIVLGTLVLLSCAGSDKATQNDQASEIVIGEVGGMDITYKELKESFSSGNPSGTTTLEEMTEFLPVYLDYRAKIASAKDAGYFEDEKVLAEYQLYSSQAAYSFWLENKIRPTLFDEFKSRFGKEFKSSHILIALPQSPTPSDTLEAYTKISEARDKYLNGSTMEELDAEYSTKRNGRSMGGDLPWFTTGTTVKEFEDVLFNLEVGEISKPFRTQFGYHIVLLEEKRDRSPERYVSHIFTRLNSNGQIDSAYARLEQGEDWDTVVKNFTMDTPSANNGGMIGWINYGSRYNADFIDSVMSAPTEVPFSKPVVTSYGNHIFKIDSVRTFPDEAAKDEYLMSQLESSNVIRKSNAFVSNWIKTNYAKGNYSDNRISIFNHLKELDSVLTENMSLPDVLRSQILFQYDDYSFTGSDFENFLRNSKPGRYTSSIVNGWFTEFENEMINETIINFTLDQFPDFSEQTDSYLNGLVVYQINEDSVWSATTVDTLKLMEIYESQPDSYSYDQRYWYQMISSSRDSTLKKAVNFIREGNIPDSLFAAGISVAISSDSTGAFQGAPFDRLETMTPGSLSEIFDYNDRKTVFYLNDILPARRMTFKESFNRLLSEYQPVREQNWLTGMREKYNVKAYPENLKSAFTKEQNKE